jgi:drug/metabolite transporter (DMT)-like permease
LFNYQVVFGVGFATFGDYNYTRLGFILTVLGTVLAAVKTVVTNRVQVGRLKLHPLDLLLRMSPLAFVQTMAYSYISGEMTEVVAFCRTRLTMSLCFALLINGVLAFFLNVVSFTANKKTSALTMTVAGNVKQVLSIVLAVIIFNLNITFTNLIGIMLTLAGGAWYT